MRKLLFLLILLPSLIYAQRIPVGRLEAVDPEGQEIYWVITAGNTLKYFSITPCSGIVEVDTTAFTTFVTQRTFTITFKATDPQGLYSKTVRKIVLKKVDGIRQKPFLSDAI